MDETPPRRSAAHRIGLVLAAPMIFLAGFVIYRYARGEFPGLETRSDLALLLGFLAGTAALFYLTPHAAVRMARHVAASIARIKIRK